MEKAEILNYINGIRCGDNSIIDALLSRLNIISDYISSSSSTSSSSLIQLNSSLESVSTSKKSEIILFLNKCRKKIITGKRHSSSSSSSSSNDSDNDDDDNSFDSPDLFPLNLHDGLGKAAQDHSDDIGENGIISHKGSDGTEFEARIESYVVWANSCAESIICSLTNPIDIVLSLLIDDDLINYRNRGYIMSDEHRYVGIGVSKHSTKGNCVIIDYVGNIAEIKGPRQAIEQIDSLTALPLTGRSYVRQEQIAVVQKPPLSTITTANGNASSTTSDHDAEGFTPIEKIILSTKEESIKSIAINSSIKVKYNITKTETTEKKERLVTNEYTTPDGKVYTFVHSETCTVLEYKPTKSRNIPR